MVQYSHFCTYKLHYAFPPLSCPTRFMDGSAVSPSLKDGNHQLDRSSYHIKVPTFQISILKSKYFICLPWLLTLEQIFFRFHISVSIEHLFFMRFAPNALCSVLLICYSGLAISRLHVHEQNITRIVRQVDYKQKLKLVCSLDGYYLFLTLKKTNHPKIKMCILFQLLHGTLKTQAYTRMPRYQQLKLKQRSLV